MHYYQHHIGDFIKATARLSDTQAMGYLRLLWMYYDSEKPLKPDAKVLAFQIGATVEETELLLESFFWLAENGWHHTRCDKEIADYREFLNKKSSAGKASAEQRKNKSSTDVQQVFNNSSTDVQLTTNHKPLTINHKPKKEMVAVAPSVWPEWMPLETWGAFLEMRKKIKKPPTEKAVDLLIAKLKKFLDSGQDIQTILEKSITNNWQDVFEIHVKQPFPNKFDVALTTTPPPPNQDAALKRIMEDDKKAVPPSLEVLARMAEVRRKTA